MWMLYTPNGGWRPLHGPIGFYMHWLAKLPRLRWQLRFIPLP
jgi:hypothetical protein